MYNLAQVLCTWDDVLAALRRKSVSWQGTPLSDRDLRTFTEAIVMSALHLTDLSTRYDGIGSQREIIAWAHNMCSLDVLELGTFLSDAVTVLRHVAEPTTYSWFKRQFVEGAPVGVFFSPIKGALQQFLAAPNPRGFYVCYQFTSFLTHLTLLDLAVDLEEEYCELEQRLAEWHYPPDILHGMNDIMRGWMEQFSVNSENFLPSHGPGAVAELPRSASALEKYLHLGADSLLRYVFTKHVGVDVETYVPFPARMLDRTSVFVSVPKSMKTRRGISKEPASLMYFQKGISDVLVDYIHRSEFLSSHIDLRDQTRNAVMAIESSRTRRYATVDLSAASDSVSTSLVKAVFRGTPLYPFLVALRSTSVRLTSGRVLRVAKFAPMGSALCFPVESLVFACAVEYAVRRARRTHLGNFPVWRVYGDDIIVANDLFQDVRLVLEALGFTLNVSKSFFDCARFRESCGGEGYDGCVVTPMKISRRFQSVRGEWTTRHAAQFEGLIEMANQCHDYQFSLLRAWVIRVILDNPLAPPLFSTTGQGALYSPCPDNFRARSRLDWDREVRLLSRPSYQRSEIQVLVSRPTPTDKEWTDTLEQARYFETLRLMSLRTSGDMFSPEHRIQVPRGSGPSRLKKCWVARPDTTC